MCTREAQCADMRIALEWAKDAWVGLAAVPWSIGKLRRCACVTLGLASGLLVAIPDGVPVLVARGGKLAQPPGLACGLLVAMPDGTPIPRACGSPPGLV